MSWRLLDWIASCSARYVQILICEGCSAMAVEHIVSAFRTPHALVGLRLCPSNLSNLASYDIPKAILLDAGSVLQNMFYVKSLQTWCCAPLTSISLEFDLAMYLSPRILKLIACKTTFKYLIQCVYITARYTLMNFWSSVSVPTIIRGVRLSCTFVLQSIWSLMIEQSV